MIRTGFGDTYLFNLLTSFLDGFLNCRVITLIHQFIYKLYRVKESSIIQKKKMKLIWPR